MEEPRYFPMITVFTDHKTGNPLLTYRYGWPLVYFKGYYNPKRQAYRLYPEKVVVPGAWDITPRWLYWHEFER